MKMRQNLNIIFFILISVGTISSVWAGDGIEKKKSISRNYKVSASDKLSIENSFGDVVVNNWDKSEFQIDIEIIVEASTDEKAQKMLDKITVTENKTGNLISFKTQELNMNHNGRNQIEFHINYKISMPAANALDVMNSFGKIELPDRSGVTAINSKFGGVKAGNISNCDKLNVEFGKAEIASLSNCKSTVAIKFSDPVVFNNVSGDIKMNIEFSGNVKLMNIKGLQSIYLKQSYSNVRMNVPSETDAVFDIYTNFGEFKNTSGIKITEEDEDEGNGPKFDKTYAGTCGSGKVKIKIKSSFGEIYLAKPSDPDKMKVKKEKRVIKKDEGDDDETL